MDTDLLNAPVNTQAGDSATRHMPQTEFTFISYRPSSSSTTPSYPAVPAARENHGQRSDIGLTFIQYQPKLDNIAGPATIPTTTPIVGGAIEPPVATAPAVAVFMPTPAPATVDMGNTSTLAPAAATSVPAMVNGTNVLAPEPAAPVCVSALAGVLNVASDAPAVSTAVTIHREVDTTPTPIALTVAQQDIASPAAVSQTVAPTLPIPINPAPTGQPATDTPSVSPLANTLGTLGGHSNVDKQASSAECENEGGGIDNHSTHHQWNPHLPVIPSGARPNHKKVDHLTAKVARDIREAKDKLFDTEIRALLDRLSADMKGLAEMHHKTEDTIKQLIIAHTNYKTQRKGNLFNALVHHIAVDTNEDCAPGDRKTLKELQRMASDTMEGLTKQEKEDLLRELTEFRKMKTSGVRCNNVAANQDYQTTVTQVGKEVKSLARRTNCVAIAFFAPAHINDTTFPCWVHSNNGSQFIADEFDMSAGEFSRKLEKWATSQNSKPKATNKLVMHQKECATSIIQGLRNITGRNEIKMSYGKYDANIQLTHKVQLRGWPPSVNFISPYNITVMSDVHLLHDALETGECFWEEIGTSKYSNLKHDLKGKAPVKKTKKHKRGENDENVDPDEQPAKKAKAVKAKAVKVKAAKAKAVKAKKSKGSAPKQVFRSRSIIDSDDDD